MKVLTVRQHFPFAEQRAASKTKSDFSVVLCNDKNAFEDLLRLFYVIPIP